MQPLIDENKMKQLMKEALIETLQEQKTVFQDMITEAIEDIALINAIRQGSDTESVSRANVFDILDEPA